MEVHAVEACFTLGHEWVVIHSWLIFGEIGYESQMKRGFVIRIILQSVSWQHHFTAGRK